MLIMANNYNDLLLAGMQATMQAIAQPPVYFHYDLEEDEEEEKADNRFADSMLRAPTNSAQFQRHFRVNKATFDYLLANLDVADEEKLSKGCKLLVALWYLATPDSFRSIANQFGVSKSTAHGAVGEVCTALQGIEQEVIEWPTTFTRNLWFPGRIDGVVGAVDGCHFSIKKPQEEPDVYLNRKGFWSLNCQAVCDKNMAIIEYVVGAPGSFHDARVFRLSSLPEQLETLPQNLVIVGDSAYPMSNKLLVPYKDNGQMTHQQRVFNSALSKQRVKVEHLFGQLKSQWRRLKHMDVDTIARAKLIVRACFILHNVCIRRRFSFEGEVNEVIHFDDVEEPQRDAVGGLFRDTIAAQL